MNKNYLIIGVATFIALILIVSIVMIIMNSESDKTENFTPALPSKYTGGSFMVMDKDGNIDTLAISELESRIDALDKKITDGLAAERTYAAVRRETLNNKINLFFPNGGKDISLARFDGNGRQTFTAQQMRILSGDTRVTFANHGNETQNRVLVYDRNSDEAKWGEESLATWNNDPNKTKQADFSLKIV